MGIRTDLLVTEEIAESSDLRATPFEFERAKRVEAALSILEGKWKIVVLNRLHILHVVHSQLIPSAQDGTGATLASNPTSAPVQRRGSIQANYSRADGQRAPVAPRGGTCDDHTSFARYPRTARC